MTWFPAEPRGSPTSASSAPSWLAPLNSRLIDMPKDSAAKRLRLALDMYETGEQMQRSRLKRLNPQATDAEIEAAVRAWRVTRPGAPSGDAVGRRSRRFV